MFSISFSRLPGGCMPCFRTERVVHCLRDLFQLAWQSTVKLWFFSAEWLFLAGNEFMNANDIWLEPTTQLFSLYCRKRFISSVPASYVSFPAPHHMFWRKSQCLCRISLGSSNLMEPSGTEMAPSTPNISAQQSVCHSQRVSLCNSKVNEGINREGGSSQLEFVVPLGWKAWWQWAMLLEVSSPPPGQPLQTDRHASRRDPVLAPHVCKVLCLSPVAERSLGC